MLFWTVLAGLAGACAPRGTFQFDVTDGAAKAAWPSLYTEGSAPLAVLEETAEPARPIAETAEDLIARAEALRDRADAMAGPVVPPDDRAKAAANP